MDLSEKSGALAVRHPWETSRCAFLLRQLDRASVLHQGRTILDVGAGDAWFAGQMSRRLGGKVEITVGTMGMENLLRMPKPIEWKGCGYCREQPSKTFELLLFLDVLEHIPEDRAFLEKTLARNAADESFVLVTVPVGSWLF